MAESWALSCDQTLGHISRMEDGCTVVTVPPAPHATSCFLGAEINKQKGEMSAAGLDPGVVS